MNAVEIEEAVSELALASFDAAEFPYAFLAAFGNKPAAIARLKSGSTNASDVPGGVLQRNHIHLATCAPSKVSETLAVLKASPRMAKAKCKFVLATDGDQVEAEDLTTGEPLACSYDDIANHFGFFLPLAGITAVAEVKNNPIDIKATGRLNKLYVELIKENEEWATGARRHDLNQFMARLIFCFFAEDTGIFFGDGLFTRTVERMSDATNTHDVIRELFRAMDLPFDKRDAAQVPRWANEFPYVNGGLFAGMREAPRFSKIARTYLLRIGDLDWKHINPDIFGSMIQSIADDEERGSLGMHYTSVPNILKALDPLFLDDLRERLDESRDSPRKLLNLRKRISSIRLFDPACGSGNFLVIAYIKLREIEAEIIRLRNDEKKSWISLTNFYGIEIKDFACETARLSLLIAEFQCDARLIGQREACLNVLPLHATGQIHCANALRKDWLEICPPQEARARTSDSATPERVGDSAEPSGETYICGNPPYLGSKKKSPNQIRDMELAGLTDAKLLDYVAAFIVKAETLVGEHDYRSALVSTSSICQGEQVSLLWPRLLRRLQISFAYAPFKWANSAARNAGVFCTIVGLRRDKPKKRLLFAQGQVKECSEISPYLVEGQTVIVRPRSTPLSQMPTMEMGSNPVDGTTLILSEDDFDEICKSTPSAAGYFRRYGGTKEMLSGVLRRCLWVGDDEVTAARGIKPIGRMIEECEAHRLGAGRDARRAAKRPHAFCYSTFQNAAAIQVGNTIGNDNRFIPAWLLPAGVVANHNSFVVYEPHGYEFAVIVSSMHRVWAEAISGRLGNGVRYANTVVYNTFPLPPLSPSQKEALRVAGQHILLAREALFPMSMAEMYEGEELPEDLGRAHDMNDETLDRIFIGRRFKNDTERLEKLFESYAKMTA